MYCIPFSFLGNRLIVGTSNRHVLIYDVRNLSQPEQRRESSLMNQTRVIRGFPDTTGYALGSIEGRVAVEYFNPDAGVQKNKYAFKCHRKTVGKTQVLYPVNAMAFHPKYGTFATGGCDGIVNVWDGANKKRICLYPSYSTSIAALNFNSSGDKLAIAASYTWEEGEKESQKHQHTTRRHVSHARTRRVARPMHVYLIDCCVVCFPLPVIRPTPFTFARSISRTYCPSSDRPDSRSRHQSKTTTLNQNNRTTKTNRTFSLPVGKKHTKTTPLQLITRIYMATRTAQAFQHALL